MDRVYRITYRILLDETLARDASQEVWIKVFQNLQRYDPRQPLPAWLTTISARTAIDFYRKQMRQQKMITYQEELFTPSRDNTFKQLEQQEIQQQIESALLGLSEMQRAAFVLRHYEGRTCRVSRILWDVNEARSKLICIGR